MSKEVKVMIETRTVNEDNFKIERLASSYKKPNTLLEVKATRDRKVEIRFVTIQGCVEKLSKDIQLLNFVGIEGRVTIEK